MVRDVIELAETRQKQSPGMQYTGPMMQHLVGAKLDCALGVGRFSHHSFSTADAPKGRVGDFLIDDVAIHVTNAPSELMIQDCVTNLTDGFRAIVVTRKPEWQWRRDWLEMRVLQTELTSSRLNSFWR